MCQHFLSLYWIYFIIVTLSIYWYITVSDNLENTSPRLHPGPHSDPQGRSLGRTKICIDFYTVKLCMHSCSQSSTRCVLFMYLFTLLCIRVPLDATLSKREQNLNCSLILGTFSLDRYNWPIIQVIWMLN